jgi:hypothetical protein
MLWQQIPSTLITEMLCRTTSKNGWQLDGVVLDLEHAEWNPETVASCIQGMAVTGILYFLAISPCHRQEKPVGELHDIGFCHGGDLFPFMFYRVIESEPDYPFRPELRYWFNAYAGVRFYGAPLIVVDFGTAVTFDVVSKKKRIFRRDDFTGSKDLPGGDVSEPFVHSTS